ncbi:MAG: DNA-3-methyladenine glycosylase [Thermoleophilaceae bacterium]|nr:DNA-3-methyladenine glycosylase [Thermoleophilaceae bacterium]
MTGPGHTGFYARSVHDVARDVLGCTLVHGSTSGRIVEVEAYHEEEPACHAFAGLTPRTATLIGPPGVAYVYRSYGVHALLNFVTDPDGVGAAVLIRALEPIDGIDLMRERRGLERPRDLCSGPGKLTQAMGIGLDLNGTPMEGGPIQVLARPAGARAPVPMIGPRIGITKALDLPWRLCDSTSDCVSRPLPPGMRRRGG